MDTNDTGGDRGEDAQAVRAVAQASVRVGRGGGSNGGGGGGGGGGANSERNRTVWHRVICRSFCISFFTQAVDFATESAHDGRNRRLHQAPRSRTFLAGILCPN